MQAKPKKAAASSRNVRRGKHEFHVKRVYDEPSSDDGVRFLVDRLWPRGIKKSALSSVAWLRDVAPSTSLRQWFQHDPDKWDEFRKRYRSELKQNSAACRPLQDAIRKDDVTLLSAARNTEMNNAVVLKEFLEGKKAR